MPTPEEILAATEPPAPAPALSSAELLAQLEAQAGIAPPPEQAPVAEQAAAPAAPSASLSLLEQLEAGQAASPELVSAASSAPLPPTSEALAPVAAPEPSPVVEQPVPATEDRVTLYDPQGRRVTAPFADVRELVTAHGYETEEARLERENEAKYGTFGQQVATAAEAIARGPTLGISDFVQSVGAGVGTALGANLAPDVPRAAGRGIDAGLAEEQGPGLYDEQAAKESLADIRGRQDTNRVLSTGLEIASGLAPSLVTGGATSLGAVGRLALGKAGAGQLARGVATLTPAGAASVLAGRVQSALVREGAGALGRIGALGVAGGVENAIAGATQRVVDDLVAGDHEISAERMLSGLGGVIEDAAIGALGAGLIGSAIEGGAALYRGAKRLAGKGAKAASDAIEGTSGALPDAAQSTADAALSEAIEPAPQRTLNFDSSLPAAEAVVSAGPRNSRSLPNMADDAAGTLAANARGATLDYKDIQQDSILSIRKDMNELFDNYAQVEHHAGLGAKREFARRTMTSPDNMEFGRQAFEYAQPLVEEIGLGAKSLVSEVGETALSGRGGLTALKVVEREAKNTMARVTHLLQNGDYGDAYMALDDFKRVLGQAQETKNTLAQSRIKEMYGSLKDALENESVWGDMAARQRVANAAKTEKIRRSQAEEVGGFLRRSGEADVDPFDLKRKADGNAIGSLLNRIDDAAMDDTDESLRMYLRSLAVDADASAKAWGGEELVRRAERVKELASRVEDRLNAAAYAKRDKAAWDKTMSWAPEGTIRGLANTAARLGAPIRAGLKKLADSAVKQQMALERAAENTGKVLMGAAAPAALKATISAKQIQRAVAQAHALQDENSKESTRLRLATNEIAQDDPSFAALLEQKHREKAAAIVAKAGPLVDGSDPFGAKPAPMDSRKRARMERYVAAVQDPGEALKRMSNGHGTKEDIEALQDVYPRLYNTYVALVREQMARAKTPPTRAQRQRLHWMTGITASREQQPDYVAKRQQGFAGQGEEQESDSLKPMVTPSNASTEFEADKRFASRTDAIMGE